MSPQVKAGKFSAEWSAEASSVTVHLAGWADIPEVVNALSVLWMQVHARALELKAAEVTVDLRGLEFMSSSCFRTLVVWLSHLNEAKEEERYKVRFVSDATRHWQRRGLSALSSFARDLVTVER